MTTPPGPWGTPNSKITGDKTLQNVKCPDGCPYTV